MLHSNSALLNLTKALSGVLMSVGVLTNSQSSQSVPEEFINHDAALATRNRIRVICIATSMAPFDKVRSGHHKSKYQNEIIGPSF